MYPLIFITLLSGFFIPHSDSSSCEAIKSCANEVVSLYNRSSAASNYYTNAPSCSNVVSLNSKQPPGLFCFSLLTLVTSNPPSCLSTITGSGAIETPVEEENEPEPEDSSKGSHHGKEGSEHSLSSMTILGAKAQVWLFAFFSVIAISVAGFACVLILPSMCTVCYNHFQQFLVAMAVGTLSGDAVLHLIPHSFFSHEDHGAEEASNATAAAEAEGGEGIENSEQKIVMKGVVLLMGLFMLYTIEQLFAILPLYTAARRARLAQQNNATRGRLGSSTSKTSKIRMSAGAHSHSHGHGHGHSHAVPRDDSRFHYSDVGTVHDNDDHEQAAPLVHFHEPCGTSTSSHHFNIPPSVAYSTSCEEVVFRLHGHNKLLEQKECAVLTPCALPCMPEAACSDKPATEVERKNSLKCPDPVKVAALELENTLPMNVDHDASQNYKHGTVLHRCHSADNVNIYYCNPSPVCLVPTDQQGTPTPNTNGQTGQTLLTPRASNATTVTIPKIVEPEKPVERESEKLSSQTFTKYPVESAVSIVTAMEGGDHSGHGHGHSHGHGHGHSHSHFGDVNSRAWMVILADAFHNLVDGMAIGVAFSSSLAGGFSTAIAVAMHELPHELGDFAVLLKEGLSIKRGLMFNALSSVICLIGAAFGVGFGSSEDFDQIIFALAAGVFLYVSLVDMLPQISSVDTSPTESVFCHLAIRLSGMLTGTGIMVCVAMLESRIGLLLKQLF